MHVTLEDYKLLIVNSSLGSYCSLSLLDQQNGKR